MCVYKQRNVRTTSPRNQFCQRSNASLFLAALPPGTAATPASLATPPNAASFSNTGIRSSRSDKARTESLRAFAN